MKTFALLPCLLVSAFLALAGAPLHAELVKLNIETADGELTVRSAFELRFEEPMVADEAVGQPVTEVPLVIKPAVAGHWVWLSTQSGVFTLAEAPPLGTVLEATLRPNLKTAAGKEFKGKLKETIGTPPFRVKGRMNINYWADDDAIANPDVAVVFAADVDPAAVAPKIWFVDAAKTKIEAKVEAVDMNKPNTLYLPNSALDDNTRLTWKEAFAEFRANGGKEPQVEESDEDEEEAPVARPPRGASKNVLRITPAKPLPPGQGWQLVVGKGLQGVEAGHRLEADYTAPIGEVKPFVVKKTDALNLVYSGKRAQLQFNKRLAKAVLKEPAKFVKLEPAPPGLKIEAAKDLYESDDTIYLTGEFELAKTYTITVAGETSAREGSTLGKPHRAEISFAPVPARLYFQDFATHQQRAGTRLFHLMGVNVHNVRVTARVVPPASAVKAMAAWVKYYKVEGPENDEWLKKVDEKTVPGTVAWQKDFSMAGVVDERKTLALNWDDILGAGKSGMVLLTVEQTGRIAPNVKRAGTQALVQVTDLGLLWKTSGDSFFHVFSLTTAQPVAGAAVKLVDAEGNLIRETKVGRDGVGRLPAPEEDAAATRWMLVSVPGGEQLVMDMDRTPDLEFGRFRINVWGDEEDIVAIDYADSAKQRGFLFSDRPVYRPGETAHLKGIVRHYTPGRPLIPAGMKATLHVFGPRSRQVLEQAVTLSEMGSFHVDVPLPRETVGYFRATLTFSEEEDAEWSPHACGFTVQEYQSNAFEVKVTAPKEAFQGAPVTLPVAAKYYMGQPLSKADLTWSLRATDEAFAPEGFENFAFTNAINDWRLLTKFNGEPAFTVQEKVALGTGGTGLATVTIPPNAKLPQPRKVRFLTEITDINQQTVAERTEFIAHSSDFYLGVQEMPDVVREGDKLPVQVVAIRADGLPEPQAIEATVKLTRIDWQTNRVEEADEADNFRSEPQVTVVSETPVKTARVTKQGSKWTVGEAGATQLEAGKAGLYLITASAKDASGRPVVTTTTFYVYGRDQLAWNYRNRFQIELVADKEEYRAGEEATVLVKTPISGPALVTVERENVRRYYFTKLEGNAPVVKVPLADIDAPNVFVSVTVLRGSQDSPKKFKAPEYRVGYTQLAVKRPDAKLYVNLKPASTAVRPGEKVSVVCEVRDVDGRPVPGAEVTLWAADEGVLSLTGFETPDPLDFFSDLLHLNVTTGLTLEHLLGEDPDERSFENKGYLVGSIGKGGEAAVRRNFLGTAYWNAALKTDANGNLAVDFAAPDGLTRYRLMAVVQSKKEQFGHAESAFEINKPLMLEPVPPRFANVGDQMIARAVLHNTSGKAGEAVVRIKFDGTVQAETSEKKVELPATGAVAVDFAVEFIEPGEAVWTWSADLAAAGLKDAVESRFQVGWPTPVLREVKQGKMDADLDLVAGLDPTLLQGRGTVRVSIANSRIFELREGVDGLLRYPYGCVEQTTSSMLPWLALRDFRTVIPELNQPEEQFKIAVEKSIARLLSMQTSNGGLGYWPGSAAPNFWASAYGGMGLTLAQQAGYGVPEEDLNRVLDYLGKELRGAAETNEPRDLSPRAFACYVLALAGRPEPAYHETLYAKRDILSQESRAFLALAILEAKGPQKMADTLLKIKDKPVEEDYWFGNLARAQAVRLLAWIRLSLKSDGTTAIADALFDLRRNGNWQTTQGNSWAVLSLADYVRRTEAGRKEIKGSLASGGKDTAFQLAAKGAYVEKEFPFDGVPSLKLLNPGKGRLYTQVKVEARPKTLITARKDRGYSLERTYQRIADDGTLSKLENPKIGDRVLVTLSFSAPAEARYLVIDDPLPANFEGVNPEFKTQAMAGANLASRWFSDFTEIRTDRALFFANWISSGRHEITYLARVRAAGTATAPPAKVEEMYAPSRFGLSDSSSIKVQ